MPPALTWGSIPIGYPPRCWSNDGAVASASPSASEQSFQSVEDKEEVGSQGKRDLPPQYSKGYPIGEMPIFSDCGRRSAHAETRRSSALDDDPCGDGASAFAVEAVRRDVSARAGEWVTEPEIIRRDLRHRRREVQAAFV